MEQKLRRDRCMGDNLRRLRIQKGISQEKLCAELQRRGCDIGRTTYAKYESGELNIRVSVLMELRRLYDCSYDAFFCRAGQTECGYRVKDVHERKLCTSFLSIFLEPWALIPLRSCGDGHFLASDGVWECHLNAGQTLGEEPHGIRIQKGFLGMVHGIP